MIAYVGEEHPRLFERQFQNRNVDLYVFRNKRYHSLNMQYKKKGTEREFFAKSDYKQMLIIYHLHFSVPDRYDTQVVYVHNNKTVAEYVTKMSSKNSMKVYI